MVDLNPGDSASLRSSLKDLVGAWLSGDAEALADAVAEDVVVIGTGPQDVFVGRQALMDGTRRRTPSNGVQADSALPTVRAGLASGGRSGWGWAFTAPSPGDGTDGLLRLTVAATRDQDRWQAVHLHISVGLPNEQLEDYRQRVPSLAPLGDEVSAEAAGLLPLVRDNMGAGRLSLIADRSDAVVIGTDPGEVFEGGPTYRAAFEPMLPQIRQLEQTMRCEFPGGLRGQLTPDGQTGFVAGNVVATFGEDSLPPFRLGWIFTRLDGAFRLVCDHHSAALPEGPTAA